jgi:outer membrane translocation and assembly module TamA
MRKQDVLALRATVRSTGGDDVPFFLLSSFGGSTDLRGYPSGRYRDRMMYALQSEYRWQFNDRWIFTGFAGFGEVADNFGDFGENYLPAAGIGTRFVLSKKHRVGLSADIAVGKDGTEFYFGVGEAF